MRIDLLFACDENYAPYAGVVLRSVWQTRKANETFRVWFIADEISQATQEKLKAYFPQMEISFLPLPDGFMAQAPLRNKHISRAAYARLALGAVLPSYVTRVIYLDCDLLVLRSLGALWNFDLQHKVLAGVEDWGVYLWRKEGRFNFPWQAAYICSGLLLVDVKRWREQRCEEKCLAYIANPQYSIRFEDQDVLNFALRGNFGILPAYWDVVLHFSEDFLVCQKAPKSWLAALKNPSVIHFATGNKPWKDICSLPYAGVFQAHMVALGLPVVRVGWNIKLQKLIVYWWKHPVFFLKPTFWKKWCKQRWKIFM